MLLSLGQRNLQIYVIVHVTTSTSLFCNFDLILECLQFRTVYSRLRYSIAHIINAMILIIMNFAGSGP
jgi:hypothetical protein